MLNSIKAKPKFSKLEKMMNKQILMVFVVQLIFCVFSGLYAAIFYAAQQVLLRKFNLILKRMNYLTLGLIIMK